MDKETLRMQMLAGVITESEYAAAINQEVEETEKDSLNEHVIGGIVGIGAINQIPSRAKADYEDAFEYFLSQKYTLNEEESVEEDLEEGKEVEEPSLYEGEEEELDEAGKPGTFKERSAMAKKARAGKDIGEKGKNFEKIAKSAAKKYGSEEAGKKVAGAVMYGKLNK